MAPTGAGARVPEVTSGGRRVPRNHHIRYSLWRKNRLLSPSAGQPWLTATGPAHPGAPAIGIPYQLQVAANSAETPGGITMTDPPEPGATGGETGVGGGR